MIDLSIFLAEHPYIDHSSPRIRAKAGELFSGIESSLERTRIAYEFVRDEIPHSFDIGSDAITARASDVLARGTGICHAKANLLAALLRGVGIPAGFCYQHITLADNDSTASTATMQSTWKAAGSFLTHAGTPAADKRSSHRENPSSRIPTGVSTTNTSGRGSMHRRRWASCGCSTPP